MARCRICHAEFKRLRMGQKVCGEIACAVEWGQLESARQKARAERAAARETKARLEKLKTRSAWMKEAQVAFNAFIRARDKDKPCICCGLPLVVEADALTGGGFDCGHYRSTGSAPHLRFDERNAHGQRKQCNRWGSGRAVDYRLGLIARIGREAVEALEADQTSRKYTSSELQAIKAHYKVKLKELKDCGG